MNFFFLFIVLLLSLLIRKEQSADFMHLVVDLDQRIVLLLENDVKFSISKFLSNDPAVLPGSQINFPQLVDISFFFFLRMVH